MLARRALQLYLYDELERTCAVSGKAEDSDSREGGIFEKGDDGKPRLRDGVSLHMYTSSVPCGNASLKRWAKGKRTRHPGLDAHTIPPQPHPRLQVTPQNHLEGQVALLLKADPSLATKNSIFGSDTAPISLEGSRETNPPLVPAATTNVNAAVGCDKDGRVAPGTALLDSGLGRILTCSDKIAKWNAVGYQGALLSSLLASPVYVDTITVGRKFSEPHCQRALCCRVQDFSSPPQFATHHPVMLGTGVKLDEGAYDTTDTGSGGGASFGSVCVAWCASRQGSCFLVDGPTGWAINGSSNSNNTGVMGSEEEKDGDIFGGESQLSSAWLWERYIEVRGVLRAQCGDGPNQLPCDLRGVGGEGKGQGKAVWEARKRAVAPEYEAAKDALFSSPKLLSGWREKDDVGR